MRIAKRTVLIIIVAISTFFIFQRGSQTPPISHLLKQIPLEEQKALEWFLRMAIASETFGYVLFGQKPLSVSTFGEPKAKPYWIEDWIDHIPSTFCCDNLKMIRGMEVWRKHQHLFPLKNFAFVPSKNFIDNGMSVLILLNKKVFIKTVSQNLKDFKNVLGKDKTPESLLNEVLHSNDVFGCVFKNHQGLIGTVLGYGRHNAWLFHERKMLWEKMYGERGRKRSESSEEDLKEYSRLNQVLKPLRHGTVADLNQFSLGLPYFAADLQHPETKKLKMEYEKAYRKMMNAYTNRNFLEVTLEKMMQAD